MRRRHLTTAALQSYRQRDYVAHLLDDRVFEAWNEDRAGTCTLTLASTGCLDALETLPAGSVVAQCNRYMRPSTYERGRGWQEVRDADALIEALLNE